MTTNPHIQFRKEVLDPISPSFCLAKWLNATIWLNSGMTASCHHPIPHKISSEEIRQNPKALHNTMEKKLARAQMLKGERPKECDYCWRVENMGESHVSDRVFKSEIYSQEDIRAVARSLPQDDSILRTLEIAFDRTCNFACAYCSPYFSSRWAQDIERSGPYQGLETDSGKHYESSQTSAEPYGPNDQNPYMDAFWKWWPELKSTLHQVRITGGEPLMSRHFWKVLESLNVEETPQLKLAVNSNLGSPENQVQKLIDLSFRVPHLEVYTSNESFESHAEYIRDGMDWRLWTKNCENIIQHSALKSFHVMMTINNLCLFRMTEFLDLLIQWKKIAKMPVIFSVNYVRNPIFHSPLVLPLSIKKELSKQIQSWTTSNQLSLLDFEITSLERLSTLLSQGTMDIPEQKTEADVRKNLSLFLNQFDLRRNKHHRNLFPKQFVDWVHS